MRHISTFENFLNEDLNERSKAGLTKTMWSKFANSKHGDLLLSKRQGVIGIRDGEVLRPIYAGVAGRSTEIAMDRGFDTDKQFTEIVEPNAASIAKAYTSLWPRTPDNADSYGKDVEALVAEFIKK